MRLLLAILLTLCALSASAQPIGGPPVPLVLNQGGLGAGAWIQVVKAQDGSGAPKVAFQATQSGSGSVTSTITIEVSNDAIATVGTVACTITLSGTAPQSDGCTTSFGWAFVRANVTAKTGSGSTVTVWAN